MPKPINRLEVQIVFDDGAFLRLTTRRKPPMSRAEIFETMQKFIEDFKDAKVRP